MREFETADPREGSGISVGAWFHYSVFHSQMRGGTPFAIGIDFVDAGAGRAFALTTVGKLNSVYFGDPNKKLEDGGFGMIHLEIGQPHLRKWTGTPAGYDPNKKVDIHEVVNLAHGEGDKLPH